ncbi:2-oxo-4-hydroxy-4-carboxy-5-ureidoimidazoline decarboxylase [Cellvibrio japonicus]|uniref:2-oxo-4-hydroxy-4-carboxy-5-ureidoimidazoline decarboxylase n=1 Tax=Cellvibrio japonicus (strain Ueda107) TaxID=498211 RepID=B3PJ38_CELJU|nr:2-oxo-4-hydroxy-4-carboxy-5-ureidoimidazoline decarboxylase [Cellvibrio japonicus]ACE84450.1 conserved hypothetical protein [Cellvibrio japonicus Ueda107]QEI11238.1 2-oxo-4-hydroxy-4-carboxy-5-ureidoimidazoline decarboxylase [Cellvibrio japonicus]QEI14812.1 2-oxo-4-hydroxy-4-carboxy-5-ureidoimidazoline decarboxylase [Cellvibrio japonicus]QEI18392.1 2-oxo-4-hydroxy-4-carboxy-5-ureidoimidazoline decarboxylase [Cellvibrio japonicus]
MTLDEFNQQDEASALTALYSCCHCMAWAQAMTAARPFADLDQLLAKADALWAGAGEAQILEAFSGHARIGDIELLRSRYAGRATAEQGQVLQASEAEIQALYQLNKAYEEKNGFIFIVCASGKSAAAMLELLQQRSHNSRDRELINGAREQGAITRLRLQQLVTD